LGSLANTNPEAAPSTFVHGVAFLDTRPAYTYKPGSDFGALTACWAGGQWTTINQVPAAISAVNIVASYTPGSTLPLTLVSTTGAGITAGASVLNAVTYQTVTGLLAIDGPSARIAFGQSATIQAWDPTTMSARALRITSGGNDSAITFNVAGFDVYGYPMTENITGANAGIATGKKAWKYIQSITASAAVASTVSVGTSDIYGMPLLSNFFGFAEINWNNTAISASTGFTVPDATSPATSTTGDVRGTYAVQSASDGTKRLIVNTTVPGNQMASAAGLFGVTPA